MNTYDKIHHPTAKRFILAVTGKSEPTLPAWKKTIAALGSVSAARNITERVVAPTFEGDPFLTIASRNLSLFNPHIADNIRHVSQSFIRRIKLTEDKRLVLRLKHDKKFAANKVKTLRPVEVRTLKALDKYAKGYNDRKYLWHLLKESGCKMKETVKAHVLPLNAALLPISEVICEGFNIKLVKRGKDWSISPSYENRLDYTPSETIWKNGKAVGYERAKNNNLVRSLALLLNDQTVIFDVNYKTTTYTLPENSDLHFDIDHNGLRVVSGKDDYHLRAKDLFSFEGKNAYYNLNEAFIGYLRGMIARNADLRRKIELERAIEEKEYENVAVCYKDSIRAGNCEAGTQSFVSRMGLDARRHYSAQELLKLNVNGDIGRLKLTLKAAAIRCRREMEQGYSVLSEHFTDYKVFNKTNNRELELVNS